MEFVVAPVWVRLDGATMPWVCPVIVVDGVLPQELNATTRSS
jgi:hypothetical protein